MLKDAAAGQVAAESGVEIMEIEHTFVPVLLGINPILTLAKQLLNMIVKLV